jgi:hypothetical protein
MATTTGTPRVRCTSTATSEKGWPTGACGLWTVTVTASTSAWSSTSSAITSASRSMRSNDGPVIRAITSPATSA